MTKDWSESRRIVSIVGARPQFVKAAMVCRALGASHAESILVHTGQHHDDEMSAVFFRELAIPAPAYDLGIHGGSHGDMTGRMLARIEEVLLAERPDSVVIFGDTNSTLAGALAAAKLHIPVAHVEAGLRSFNRRMPEEINRVVADHLSTLLFCPTSAARTNLEREGIVQGVHVVGDVMMDASRTATELARRTSTILERLGVPEGGYAVATVHRAESTDEPSVLAEILAWLDEQAAEFPVILPVHPRLRAAASKAGLAFGRLRTAEPLGYIDMQRLLAGCRAVFTDSGGLQKEAYFHRKPCVTLRGETEWVETIACGWNRLWRGPDYVTRRDIAEYGDGHAARRMAEILLAPA